MSAALPTSGHVQKFLGGRRSFKNAQNWGSRERLSVLFTSLLGDVADLFLLHPVQWLCLGSLSLRGMAAVFMMMEMSMLIPNPWKCGCVHGCCHPQLRTPPTCLATGSPICVSVFFSPNALNFPLDRSATSKIHFVDCKKVAFQTGFLFVQ